MSRQSVAKLSYSVREACAATGVGESSILAAVARGELAVRRVGPKGSGRKIVIHGPSLEAWVAPDPHDPEGGDDDA